jgi:hypothetical protein
MTAPLSTFGALALECSAPMARSALAREEAAELADHVAADLARFLPGVERVDLALAAAAFDPSELLRVGWPVHAALDALVERAPEPHEPRVMGFGSHQGKMPEGLEPDPALHGGPLRLVPFVLRGGAQAIAAVGREMEENLLEKGMAQAATAFFAQRAFNAPMEHARYLSLNDLLAMTAMQYEHAGIAPLWPLIETALLSPEREAWLDAPPEPLARWTGGEVRIALMDLPAWSEHGFMPTGIDAERIGRAFDRFQMRQQQFSAVLGSHGIAVRFDHCSTGEDPRQVLRA